MPSLKEIKGRIASVNSTRKITSAMKMVASSKLHHAQVAIQNMLPYETLLEHILKSFLASEAEAQTVFDQERHVRRVALVVFSSNSSLCGGFNANIIRLMQHTVDAYTAELGEGSVEVYPIGRKVADKARKLGYDVKCDCAELIDHPKRGFGPPTSDWMRGCLKPMMHDLLTKNNLEEMGFSVSQTSKLLNFFMKGEGQTEHVARLVWNIFQYSLWYNHWMKLP